MAVKWIWEVTYSIDPDDGIVRADVIGAELVRVSQQRLGLVRPADLVISR